MRNKKRINEINTLNFFKINIILDLIEPINIINEINIRDQVRPFGLCIAIVCFSTSWISHCWNDTRRLFTSRVGEGKSKLGNTMIKRTIGRPINVGVMKEANRFSFIFLLKEFYLTYLFLGLLKLEVNAS
uniref:Uncharacterized protein n=1 Tax=Urocitellus parryii TaxID=9999 RepID=A0A8D2GRC9_UROPR